MLQPQCLFYSNTSAKTGPQHQNCLGRSSVKNSVQRAIFFQTEELASPKRNIQLEFPFCRLIKPVASTTEDNNFQYIGNSQSFGSSRRSFPRALYHSFVHPIEKWLFSGEKSFYFAEFTKFGEFKLLPSKIFVRKLHFADRNDDAIVN